MRIGTRVDSQAAIFICPQCDGKPLGNGVRSSPYQIFRPKGNLIVCNFGHIRSLLIDGEAIPIDVAKWNKLPTGFAVTLQPR